MERKQFKYYAKVQKKGDKNFSIVSYHGVSNAKMWFFLNRNFQSVAYMNVTKRGKQIANYTRFNPPS